MADAAINIPAPVAVLPVVFALAPGLQDNTIIDYGTTAGRKLYEGAVTSLYTSGEDKYDGEEGSLHNFCLKGVNHADAYGWEDVHMVPIDPTNPDDLLSLWTEYGLISMEAIHDHVLTYVSTQSRVAQDSIQMYRCLFASLTIEAQNRIAVWSDDYTVNGIKSGALFLKVIVRESHADTNATTRKIRGKLMNLETEFAGVNFDVTKLNSQVKIWVQQLQARGETTQDLLANLLRAYKTSPDSEIVDYVKQKTNDYDKGQEFTADSLMHLVGNKYVTRSNEEDFEDGRKDQDKIIALEAKLTALAAAMQKGNSSEGGGNASNQQTQKGKKTLADWQTVKPTEAEKNAGYTKVTNGKQVFYCTKHGYWCAHLAKDCKTKGLEDKSEAPSAAKAKKDGGQQRLVQSYLAAVGEEDGSDSESN